VHACRLAKETLLADDPPRSVPLTVAARGSKLIGGTLRDEITLEELTSVIDEGFFPEVARDATPGRPRGGLQELGGLPYAADPAITRHLAGFLARHGSPRIDAVLFNGGAVTPAALRRRVLALIATWQPDDEAPRELENHLPELAVARGAAYYGLVRRGLGARIRGGTPRTFYVGVTSDVGTRALCLAPRGLDEVSTVE